MANISFNMIIVSGLTETIADFKRRAFADNKQVLLFENIYPVPASIKKQDPPGKDEQEFRNYHYGNPWGAGLSVLLNETGNSLTYFFNSKWGAAKLEFIANVCKTLSFIHVFYEMENGDEGFQGVIFYVNGKRTETFVTRIGNLDWEISWTCSTPAFLEEMYYKFKVLKEKNMVPGNIFYPYPPQSLDTESLIPRLSQRKKIRFSKLNGEKDFYRKHVMFFSELIKSIILRVNQVEPLYMETDKELFWFQWQAFKDREYAVGHIKSLLKTDLSTHEYQDYIAFATIQLKDKVLANVILLQALDAYQKELELIWDQYHKAMKILKDKPYFRVSYENQFSHFFWEMEEIYKCPIPAGMHARRDELLAMEEKLNAEINANIKIVEGSTESFFKLARKALKAGDRKEYDRYIQLQSDFNESMKKEHAALMKRLSKYHTLSFMDLRLIDPHEGLPIDI